MKYARLIFEVPIPNQIADRAKRIGYFPLSTNQSSIILSFPNIPGLSDRAGKFVGGGIFERPLIQDGQWFVSPELIQQDPKRGNRK